MCPRIWEISHKLTLLTASNFASGNGMFSQFASTKVRLPFFCFEPVLSSSFPEMNRSLLTRVASK